MNKGNIYLLTGKGWGKTTSALGVALRAAGHKKKSVIIHFMKGRKDVGEWKAGKLLEPYVEMHQFGRKEFVNLNNPSEKDIRIAKKALDFAFKTIRKKPFLLVLDEINIAAKFRIVSVSDVLELLDSVPETTTVYLTGRYAPKKLVDRADYVTEIRDIKNPDNFSKSKKGIDY